MMYVKLQITCLIIVLLISFVYHKQINQAKISKSTKIFQALIVIGIISLIFDGITAYTVNNLELIPHSLNLILHIAFFIGIDSVVFMLFLYMLVSTDCYPQQRKFKILLFIPYLINIILVIFGIGDVKFIIGNTSNYSIGLSAYTCFATVGIYTLCCTIIFIRKWAFLEQHKRISIAIYLFILILCSGYQMIFPESLITSLGTTVLILGVYMTQEDPAINELMEYHKEMVFGFATLIENRDESTGEHVRRTTAYVKLLVDELAKEGYYRKILTKEYINDLIMAAPLHDIGKIALPDAILQKPGKLTPEEFEQIKYHTVAGGKIINETFAKLNNVEYSKIAYNVARYHHEKWNGNGYPEQLKGEDIPLCARIMAIADVFDAVSQKRCYREALPLDECFTIIADGKDRDFDPLLVEVFLSKKTEVIKILNESLKEITQ